MNPNELREKRAKVIADARAILNQAEAEKRDATAEELQRFDALMAEAQRLADLIKRAEQIEAEERALAQPRPAFDGARVVHLRESGTTEIEDRGSHVLVNESGEGLLDDRTLRAIRSTEYRQAFRRYLRRGLTGLSADEVRALQEGVDEQGGFLVPEDMLARIIAKAPAPTRVASRVTRLTTGRDALVVPKVVYTTDDIYTTGIRVTWTGEVPASSTAHRVTEPVFGQFRVPIYTAMMSMPITNDMVEDANFPIVQWSSDRFRETIDLLYGDMILNGSGIGQPRGILLNPGGANEPSVVNSGDANTLTGDGLQDIAWSLPEQYDENAAWVFNKTSTGKTIAKLKDADNRYLWATLENSGFVESVRARPLLGYPVLFDAFMPNVAANAFPIVFGDLSGYYLVNRIGFSVQVLRELYAETNQILLLGRLRFGGAVAEPWKIKIQKVAL